VNKSHRELARLGKDFTGSSPFLVGHRRLTWKLDGTDGGGNSGKPEEKTRPDNMNLSGVILAGGKSSRMGRDKAVLLVHGEPLLVRQLRLLAELRIAERLVSLGAGTAPPVPLPEDVRVLPDIITDAGPLAGLERALAQAGRPLVLALAVDLPAMNPEFLRRLTGAATEGCGVVPLRGGLAEPLVAIYPRAGLAEIQRRLQRRELALQSLVRAGLADGWLRGLPVPVEDEPLFTNWNRPDDVAAGVFSVQ